MAFAFLYIFFFPSFSADDDGEPAVGRKSVFSGLSMVFDSLIANVASQF